MAQSITKRQRGGFRLPLYLLLLVAAAAPVLGFVSGQDPADDTDLRPEIAILRTEAESPGEIIRIVSFNVKLGERLDELTASLRENPVLRNADVLLLQEIESFREEGASRARTLAEILQWNFVYAPARRQERKGRMGTHGLAILSRFPLQDIQIISLPQYNLRVNTRRRIALAAIVNLPGGALRLYNLHLDTRINAGQRLEQLRPVVEAAQAETAPVVVIGGDFNTNPFRWAASLFPWFRSNQAKAVDNYMAESGFSTPLRKSGSTARRGILRFRLDALYVKGTGVRGHGVERSAKGSDHYPLWVDLAWPPAPDNVPSSEQ